MLLIYVDVFANLLMLCLIFVKSEFEILHILVTTAKSEQLVYIKYGRFG